MAMPTNAQNTQDQSAGGALVLPETRNTVVEKFLQRSGVLAQCEAAGSVTRNVNSQHQLIPIIDPSGIKVFAVGEGNAIGTTKAATNQATVHVKDIAAIVRLTNQQKNDANAPGRTLIDVLAEKVPAQIADFVDANMLGYQLDRSSGTRAEITSTFDFALGDAPQVEIDTSKADGLALGISEAIEEIESAGYSPTGVVWSTFAPRQIRDARLADGRQVYSKGDFGVDGPNYGLLETRSSHLDNFVANASGGAAKLVGVVGDFSAYLPFIREDMDVAYDASATVDGVSAFENVLHNYRWLSRIAAGATPKAQAGAFRALVVPAAA